MSSSLVQIKGLRTYHNELNIKEGSLVIATCIIIDRNDVAQPRRGFANYGTAAAAACDRFNQIFEYKGRILRHYDCTLQFDCDGAGTFASFAGTYSETEAGVCCLPGLRIKGIEANSNFYFTTSTGIKKISAATACDLVTTACFIVDAGAPRALDLTGTLSFCCAGFLCGNSKVAYRLIWEYTDANKNLVRGAPSSRFIATNNNACCSANICITAPIPAGINVCYRYGLYRSKIDTCACGCATPDDEMNLVFCAFVTAAQISAGTISIADTVCETLRAGGELLYTNPITGQGITQSNNQPPIAKDIANFQNSTFYANIKTAHTRQFTLLSTTGFVSGTSKLVIGNTCIARTYTFRGAAEVFTICVVENCATSLCGDYILINSANNERKYAFYFGCCAPCACDTTGRLLVSTTLGACDVPACVACKLQTSINAQPDFTATKAAPAITVSACSVCFCPNNTFTLACHGLVNGHIGRFTTTCALPGGLAASTCYYIVCVCACTFKVSATSGGCAINLCSAGTGCHTFTRQVITVTAAKNGNMTNAANGATSPGFNFIVTTAGDGADSCNNDVLLSSLASPAQAIDETARSLVCIINQDACSPVYAYYLSGPCDLPGLMRLKNRCVGSPIFTLGVEHCAISTKFSPALSVSQCVASFSTAGAPTTVTTCCNHGYSTGNCVYIYCTPCNCVTGIFCITSTGCTTFTITEATGCTSTGKVFLANTVSDNCCSPNKIFYSKTGIPEAVPLANNFSVGTKDNAIKRILPLRNSLFVFKENEGTFLITGNSAEDGFTTTLLDNSTSIIAPDSAVILNNQIYLLSDQGVLSMSDTGTGTILSLDIQCIIEDSTNSNMNFATTAFGIGYESDRSYILALPSLTTDKVATQLLRYYTFNKNWTKWAKTSRAGLVLKADDKLYLSKGDDEFLEQERKNKDRTDYADQCYSHTIASCATRTDASCNFRLQFPSLTNVKKGDVVTQCQFVTIDRFNRLLSKLDSDGGLTCTDYASTLTLSIGECLGAKLKLLNTKIIGDDCGGTYTPTNCLCTSTFTAIGCEWNSIITTLNSACSNSDLTYTSNTVNLCNPVLFESPMHTVCNTQNEMILAYTIPLLAGAVTTYRRINSVMQWAPQHFGDPGLLKQVGEGTIIFDQNNFYEASISYASDIDQELEKITFLGQGTGIFGGLKYNCGVWGGEGNDLPLRTLIPRNKQKGRYVTVQFDHAYAREGFKINGISFKIREISSRGYR